MTSRENHLGSTFSLSSVKPWRLWVISTSLTKNLRKNSQVVKVHILGARCFRFHFYHWVQQNWVMLWSLSVSLKNREINDFNLWERGSMSSCILCRIWALCFRFYYPTTGLCWKSFRLKTDLRDHWEIGDSLSNLLGGSSNVTSSWVREGKPFSIVLQIILIFASELPLAFRRLGSICS